MKKISIVPIILIFIAILGLSITVYLVQQEETLDIREKAQEVRTVRVCASGCDYSDINQAFANAQDNDTIFLDTGEYDGMGVLSGSATLNLPDDVKNLTIKGKGNDETIWKLSYGAGGMGHLLHIENLNEVKVTISDIAFQDNIHVNSSVHIYGTNPEGVSDSNANVDCEFNFENVKVTGSLAAGIYLSGNNSSHVKDSYFASNEWPGVSIHGQASVKVENSKFKDHKHQGVDAKGEASVEITRCEFTGNNIEDIAGTRSAIGCYINSNCNINNCTLSNNHLNAISIKDSASIQIRNCIVINNGFSGVVFDDNSSGSVINNTILHNSQAGILFGDNSGGSVKNNIIIGNQGYCGISGWDFSGSVEISYNDVWHNYRYDTSAECNYGNGSGDEFISDGEISQGDNDISLDHKFVSDTDFHLQDSGCGQTQLPCGENCPDNCSPAIDAGDPDSQYNDIDGSRNDMGAYGGSTATTSCTTDDDCKPICNGKKRSPYSCNESNQCVVATALECEIECGAECENNTDCSTDKVCNPETCSCEDATSACTAADIWGSNNVSDGVINMWDMSKILGNFNTNSTLLDIWGDNGVLDGRVNLWDLSKVQGCWKKEV